MSEKKSIFGADTTKLEEGRQFSFALGERPSRAVVLKSGGVSRQRYMANYPSFLQRNSTDGASDNPPPCSCDPS